MTDGPARRVLALDTGPAIYLDALGYVPTVSRVSDIVIPGAVADELRARLDRPGATVPELSYVSVRHPAPQQVDAVAEQATLDPGESEVLALALGSGGRVVPVLDDLDARRHAERCGIRKTGTLGVLVELHQRGLAADTIEADLERLRSAGHWLGGSLAASAIERVRHTRFIDRPSNPRLHRVPASRAHWPVHRQRPGPGPRDTGR